MGGAVFLFLETRRLQMLRWTAALAIWLACSTAHADQIVAVDLTGVADGKYEIGRASCRERG